MREAGRVVLRPIEPFHRGHNHPVHELQMVDARILVASIQTKPTFYQTFLRPLCFGQHRALRGRQLSVGDTLAELGRQLPVSASFRGRELSSFFDKCRGTSAERALASFLQSCGCAPDEIIIGIAASWPGPLVERALRYDLSLAFGKTNAEFRRTTIDVWRSLPRPARRENEAIFRNSMDFVAPAHHLLAARIASGDQVFVSPAGRQVIERSLAELLPAGLDRLVRRTRRPARS